MDQYSYLGNADVSAIDELYQQYLKSPTSVSVDWAQFFKGFDFARETYGDHSNVDPEKLDKEFCVINLINGYRQRGHLWSKTNPIRPRRVHPGSLALETYGLSASDLDTVFQAGNRIPGCGPATLRKIIDWLDQTYCGSIGVEYKFVRVPNMIEWLEEKMERCKNTPELTISQKKRIFQKLNQATVFENFLHTKYVGQKRFSLEGSETIIPALDAILEFGAELGISEFVFGMAHRGRLNVLANILGKTYDSIFTEFEGKAFANSLFEGDVKYHMGYSSTQSTSTGKSVKLNLLPNPSHLEAVNPVVEGLVRSKLDLRYKNDENKICPILIHGDASVAGQGIVYEVLQMSLLDGYRTGGTVHVVLNNQIGFTTNYHDARSSTYCTDVAKTTLSPVFHVNGDDVEAVVYVIQLALSFRQTFHRDVFVDILSYRKHGHNEGDEPRFTQPLLYKLIANHPNPREVYNQKLISKGSVEANLAHEMEQEFKSLLQERLEEARQRETSQVTSFLQGNWSGLRLATPEDFELSPETGVPRELFHELGDRITTIPEDKKFFDKTRKLYQDRKKMIGDAGKLDWGMGETMAYATLLHQGNPIRLSGEDVERGTFSHRHAVLLVEDSEEKYVPLRNISEHQARFEIYNSLLSEYGVLGFEFGYALYSPRVLTIWEAQFGDFANGAQIIIDQFISCAETKWQRMNGLVMLLPHGYEGQGPEHSSARPERFLALCADNNMIVANCTTPASLFHLLRRQMIWPIRKPLVIFTPKSLLRHPACVSPIDDFIEGTRFHEVLDDSYVDADKVGRVLFCTGKIYYELLERQQSTGRKDVAIVRLEQLNPLPSKQIQQVLDRYSAAKQWLWVQEEPENMGYLNFMLRRFKFRPLETISRKENATPATGFYKIHNAQQKDLIDRAFA
ncbi:MAG: 2-oxoglutarate dehydrogenase E1 component [SAR324 cluster bacterium]|nr:2-oxoglutarate dehydrogenase E1 component [SAR324 cluster bacterium]